jgi:hypothetical protein
MPAAPSAAAPGAAQLAGQAHCSGGAAPPLQKKPLGQGDGASSAAPAAHAKPGGGEVQGAGAAPPPAHQKPAGQGDPNSSGEPNAHAEPGGAEQATQAAASVAPGLGLNVPSAQAAQKVPGEAEKRPAGQA